jgi:predicted anti-sigma-YlaC factor YlaD
VSDHGGYDELAVAHGLDALDRADEVLFVAHLAGCARCRELVDETRTLAGALATTLPSEQPPPGLRRRTMRRAFLDRQPASAFAAPPADFRPAAFSPADASPPAERLSAASARLRLRLWPPPRRTLLLALAAALIGAALLRAHPRFVQRRFS